MEGTSSYGFQRHKSAETEAAAMEHRVGFRDMICFVDMVGLDTGSTLWIWSVLEIGSVLWIGSVVEVGWKRTDRIKLNQNKSNPATKLN
jgi:hypothetical protein